MSWVDIEMVMEILKQDSSISEPEHPQPANITKGEIEFKDVYFTYDGDKPTAD
jgi:ABC-type multidrug transport system fused ATPase/permease subunit